MMTRGRGMMPIAAALLVGIWCSAARADQTKQAEYLDGPPLDVAPFTRVLAWDPEAMEGTKANRSEEFPAQDIAPYRELLPSADNTYTVPIADGTGCIGLQWDEERILHRIGIMFPDGSSAPPAESVQMQYWTGESAWQGKWQPAQAGPEKAGNSLVWTLGDQELTRGTQKARWVFSAVTQPIVLKKISAFTRSPCKTVSVRIEPTQAAPAKAVRIEVYNGFLLKPDGNPSYLASWDGRKPLLLQVRANVTRAHKADRTVLRFQFPDTAFGVAIEDLLANDCVYVPHAGLFVTRDPAPVTPAEYLAKIATRKTMLEDVRQQPDQDFRRAFDTMHTTRQDTLPYGHTLISLACDNRKFIVERCGAVVFNEFESPDDFPGASDGVHTIASNVNQWRLVPRFANKDLPIARRLAGGWLPMPVQTAQDGQVSYQQTTYVAPVGEVPPGKPAWRREKVLCGIEYELKNAGDEPSDARLSLQFASQQDPPRSVQYEEAAQGIIVTSGGRLLAFIDTRQAAPLSAGHGPEGVVLSGALPRQGAARCVVYLPAWKAAPAESAAILQGGPWAPRVETYWNDLFQPAMQIDVPDTRLNNLIRASQVHCMLAARNADRSEFVVPWISSIHFAYPESEANSVMRGMDLTGHSEFARRGLEFYLKESNPAGFITILVHNKTAGVSCGYTLVGTGEVLWTLGEYYQRTRDRAWLRKVAPDVVRICQWVIRQREKTKRLDARGDKVPEYGLMPPGVSADWNRFAYRFFNDAQYYRGLLNAAHALADAGDPAGPAILDEAKRYREDIARAYHAMQARMPVVALKNGTWVPADPSLLGCYGNVEDFLPGEDVERSYCYSVELGAHHLVANEILDPRGQDADWMINYLEDVQFLRTRWLQGPNPKDPFTLGGFAKMQPYYCRIAEVYAQRDDVKPFIRSYFNPIAALVNFEDLTFWEDWNGGQTGGAWNKTHETGWFLSQTRTMLVTERGDELWLAPFVTNRWLQDGMKVAVRNAPTRFGNVNYAINSAVSAGHMDATIQLPTPTTTKRIVLRLRHPEGRPIQSVTVQGRPHTDFDPQKETVTIVPDGEAISVQTRYH